MGKYTSAILALIIINSGAVFFLSPVVESSGSGDYPPPASGDWIISNPTHVGNETIVLNGNLTIMPSGSLTFHNVTLKMNCPVNGSYHINVTGDSSFYIYDLDNDNTTTDDASVITSNIADGQHRYLFWVRKDAELIMMNSELHECGYEFNAAYDRIGLYIETDDAIIDHNYIAQNGVGIVPSYCNITLTNNTIIWNNGTDHNGYGLWIWHSHSSIKYNKIESNWVAIQLIQSNSVIEGNTICYNGQGINVGGQSPQIINNTIISNIDDGIFVPGASYPSIIGNYIEGGNFGIASTTGSTSMVINTTIESTALYDISAGPDCHFTMVNCTFNKTKVRFSNSLSDLTVRWYLHTYVNDINSIPISGAFIDLKNSTNTTVFTEQTDAGGWQNWTVVTEYVQNDKNGDLDGDDHGEIVYHTAHNIATSKAGYYAGYAEVNMNESKSVTITLNPLSNFTQQLHEGWNLISLPLMQNNESVDSVLQSIDGKWDRLYAYDTTDVSDPWKFNRASFPDIRNELNYLNHRHGIWLNVTEACTLTVWGIQPTTTNISLYAGWNLVGYPKSMPSNASETLFGTGTDMVAVYNATSPYLVEDLTDLSSITMQAGEGYWVHVPADTVWTVDW